MYRPLLSLFILLLPTFFPNLSHAARPVTAASRHAAATASPDTFPDRFRTLLTARWTAPFGAAQAITRHAPAGPYLGNGEVGVVAYASQNAQTLRLSKVNFVTDGKADWAGAGAAALPAGEVHIAVKADTTGGMTYLMDQVGACLDMRTGTTQPVRMVTWMTMDEDYVVTEVHNRSSAAVEVDVTARGLPSDVYATTLAARDDILLASRRTQATGNVRWVSQVGWSTRIIGAPSVALPVGNALTSSRRMTIAAGTTAYVVTLVTGGGKTDDADLDGAYTRLRKVSARRIAAMRRGHDEWWREMWTRSYIEIADSLLQRQYLTSIYLMASAYSPRTTTCGGMYGVWNMDDDMMYHGDIHLNYNSQAGFYSVFSANRPELALPFFDFLERMIPEGRRRAQEEMGSVHPSLQGKRCRGILFPVSALGIGAFYGKYWQQTMDAPFNVCLYSWYYEYTHDEDFLRHRAYPFIRECGDFYEDYIVREPYGSSYRYSITTGGHESSWDLNPPSDLALVEQTFRLLLRYSTLLGVDTERRALWQDIVSHMPAYAVTMPQKQPNAGKPIFAKNEAGWDWPAHVIQLHGVYPCELLTLSSSIEKRELACNTLQYYGVDQRGFTETMNELGLSAFVMGARVGFPAEVLVEKLRLLSARGGTNFLIRDGHHCLEKAAIVETLHSMMLQSVDGVLRLFPCWTQEPASFTRLRTKGAYIVSAAYDGNAVQHLEIQSTQGGLCRILNPWPGRTIIVQRKGQSKAIAPPVKDGIISFPTQKGRTYVVSHL